MLITGRRRCCGIRFKRLPFLITLLVLVMMNFFLWCNVFGARCAKMGPVSLVQLSEPVQAEHTGRNIMGKKDTKGSETEESARDNNDSPAKNYTKFHEVIGESRDHVKELQQLVQRQTLFNNSANMFTMVNYSALALEVPTIAAADKEVLTKEIQKMSEMKREYEIDEMMKLIEKNEHNLKRLNISILLSKENNANFEKKAAKCKAQLDELVSKASDMGLEDDSQYHLMIQKLLDDLDKIDERMKKYNMLLEKQKGLIIRKLELQQNLTFFESVIHS